MEHEILHPQEVINRVIHLKGEQRIFTPVDRDLCNELKFIDYKKSAYNNLLMSYVNFTAEQANEFNLNAFLDKVGELYTNEQQIIEHLGRTALGDKLYNYLADAQTVHGFYIDYEQGQLIIYNQVEGRGEHHSCHDGACSHNGYHKLG